MTMCIDTQSNEKIFIPASKHKKIPVEVYISKKIPESADMVKRIRAVNKKLNNPFLIRTINVDFVRSPSNIINIPSISIGDIVITEKNITPKSVLRYVGIIQK